MLTKTIVIPATTVERTFAQHVGSRVKQRRLELKWTQDVVIAKCGMSKAFLSEVENGKRSIGFMKLYSLARALRRSTDWFAKGWD